MPAPLPIYNDGVYSVAWQYGYVYPYSGVPLYWYAQFEYQAVGTQNVTISCQNPVRAVELMRGTGNSGSVQSQETDCTRDPNFATTLAPGGKYEGYAIFHNVPWTGAEVAMDLGVLGQSPYGNQWGAQFDYAPPTPPTGWSPPQALPAVPPQALPAMPPQAPPGCAAAGSAGCAAAGSAGCAAAGSAGCAAAGSAGRAAAGSVLLPGPDPKQLPAGVESARVQPTNEVPISHHRHGRLGYRRVRTRLIRRGWRGRRPRRLPAQDAHLAL
jgi:hypothetical protein